MEGQFQRDNQFIKFCLYGFLKNLRFFEPFFMVWLLQKDLSFFQIGIVYAVREMTRNIFEIPSGFVADVLGRKKALIASYSVYILSFLGYYFAGTYGFILAASFLYGIGDAFRTGTHKALIFSYLKQHHITHLQVEYYGTTRSWSMRGSALSAILAAILLLVSDHYNDIFLWSTLPYLLGILLIISYPESIDTVKQVPLSQFFKAFKVLINDMVKTLRSPGVVRILFNSALLAGFYLVVRDYLQPILQKLSQEIDWFPQLNVGEKEVIIIGVCYFIIYNVSAMASQNAKRLMKHIQIPEKAMNITYAMGFGAGMMAGGLYYFDLELLAAVGFLVIMVLHNIRKPIAMSIIANRFSDHLSGSAFSTESQLQALLASVMAPLLGIMADHFNIGIALLMINGLLLSLLFILKIKTPPT